MRFLMFLSDALIPILVFYIVGFGILMKKNIYDDFLMGAKEGIQTVVGILPTLVGLMNLSPLPLSKCFPPRRQPDCWWIYTRKPGVIPSWEWQPLSC